MTKILRMAAIATSVLLLHAGQGRAINMMTIGDLPIRHMTEDDRSLLADAVRETLEQDADGQARAWENPKTGARGELTPLATFEREGRKCRDLEIANSARGHSNRLVLTLCTQDDGDWKIQPR